MGNYPKAELLFIEGIDVITYNINQNFAFLSEKEKELYFNTQEGTLNFFNSFALKRKQENPAIVSNIYNNTVRNKGLLLKSSTAMRFAILNSGDTSLIAKYETWVNMKKEISKLYSTEISKRSQIPEELEQKANAIEKDLVRGSQVFSDFEKIQNLSWKSVKNSLKPGEVAIEFIHFKSESSKAAGGSGSKQSDTVLYCALLIMPDCKYPEMLRLFEEKDIELVLGKMGHNNLEYINDIYGTNQYANEALYKLIWQPLEKHLTDVKTIYYSPDGLLHKVSFAALGTGKNMYLCDNYKLQQLSSTGKLSMPESPALDKDLTAGLFGGIQYSSDSTSREIWKFLPGTKIETYKIEQVFKSKNVKTTCLSGTFAKEAVFKAIAGNFNLIHIATHGFFYHYPEEERKAKADTVTNKIYEPLIAFRGGTTCYGEWQFVKNNNPLMRSGLVFADANKVWSQQYAGSDNDGILTSMEITQLDLRKTQLVVMSACETGLGDIKGSEGVYGLQRAFKMAGVKFIIMSLWQVPDKETSEFMTAFYTKFLTIKNIRTAFYDTQKEMRQKYDPYYWGAFVLIE